LRLKYLAFRRVNFLNSGVSCPTLNDINGRINECVALSQYLIQGLVHEGPLVPTGRLLLNRCLKRERARPIELWWRGRLRACNQKVRSEIDLSRWNSLRLLGCLKLLWASLLSSCPSYNGFERSLNSEFWSIPLWLIRPISWALTLAELARDGIGGTLTLGCKARRGSQSAGRRDKLFTIGTWYPLFRYRVGFGSCRVLHGGIFVVQGCLMYGRVPSLMPAYLYWVFIHINGWMLHRYLICRVFHQPVSLGVITRLLRDIIPHFILI
jgi:hypothetical protein